VCVEWVRAYLTVDINQHIGLKKRRLRNLLSTFHRRLFINSNECFQLTAPQRRIAQQSQREGHTDAIVSTQCRAISVQPLAIQHGRDGIARPIMLFSIAL
jgi:hypothetical protein